MKGLICGIKRMEIHDGEGIRTTVFFKGCPLKCIWCHNPESILPTKQLAHFSQKCIACKTCIQACKNKAIIWKNDKISIQRTACKHCGACEEVCPVSALTLFGREYVLQELVEELLVDKPFFDSSNGGVTLSGGECLMQSNFTISLIKELYQRGVRVNLDTCGFVKTSIFDEILPYIDTFLYDLKAIDGILHKKLTGQDNALILQNLSHLLEKGAKVEIRFPLVTGFNDCQIEKIGAYLSAFENPPPIKVLRYHALAKSRYSALDMEDTLPTTTTTLEDMERAVNILKSYHLHAINGALDA